MGTQIIIIVCTLAVFAGLGYGMSKSISSHDQNKLKQKKKKGRTKNMPEVKNPGR